MEETVVSIKLMFDWQVGPLWVKTDQKSIADPYTAEEASELVRLSRPLIDAITKWDEEMQSTYDGGTHEDLGFADSEKEREWIKSGKDLAQRIKTEVGEDVSVRYVPLVGDSEPIKYGYR